MVRTVAQTPVVSPEGSVKANWRGAFDARLQKEIEAKLRVHIPGLTSGPRYARSCVEWDLLLDDAGVDSARFIRREV
jgi:hypothetical protein